MIYVNYIPATRTTGKALARALGASFGIRGPRNPPTALVRWGSRRTDVSDPPLVLNSAAAIARASDKLKAFALWDARNLPHVPVLVGSFAEAQERWPDKVLLGRRARGFGARDIVCYLPECPAEVARHDFFTPFIPSRSEVRIHVVGDDVIRVQRKYLDFPDQQRNPYIRNHGNGFRFRAPTRDLHYRRLQTAIEATRALGLNFGAVDMLLLEDDSHLLLEVNTAPGCSPLTLSCYVDAIKERLATCGVE